jgi:hypothetical protein
MTTDRTGRGVEHTVSCTMSSRRCRLLAHTTSVLPNMEFP